MTRHIHRQVLGAAGAAAIAATLGAAPVTGAAVAAVLPAVTPAVSDYAQVSASETPPTQAQCNSVGRRCFNPASTRAAYNVNPLYRNGFDGTGITIAVVDSFGSDTMAHDLHVYNRTWGLPSMCGEEGVACTPGMPTFTTLSLQGSPATKAPPSTAKSPGQQDKSAWALEVALDVETAHSMAPGANIILVTTPVAETLGVQGLPQMMAAEQYIVDHHLAQVISQSFGTAEDAFGSSQSLLNLRHAFVSAQANHVTVLASSGDFGSANVRKSPVGGPNAQPLIPFPTVGWPASDPLVTGVGGTYLCTDALATSGRILDTLHPPANCQPPNTQAEVGWIDSGGGFSHVFPRPAYQSTLPAMSTPIPASSRGVPDIALQASSRTGALVYLTLPPAGDSGLICGPPGSPPCSTGWYDIGGTSLSSPEWAGLIAIADQINGGGLGLINPGLYKLGANPAAYASDFFDVTTGNNGAFAPDVPGFPATIGWDPVTGLGTPNAAALLPALVAAVNS
jgi:subtilase family serine protease